MNSSKEENRNFTLFERNTSEKHAVHVSTASQCKKSRHGDRLAGEGFWHVEMRDHQSRESNWFNLANETNESINRCFVLNGCREIGQAARQTRLNRPLKSCDCVKRAFSFSRNPFF